jgi:hypothetical protein
LRIIVVLDGARTTSIYLKICRLHTCQAASSEVALTARFANGNGRQSARFA